MSEAITRGVQIVTVPEYLEHESIPEDGYYVFAYHITITNQSETTVQLLSRHWVITDANGRVEEVQGPGVVGLQPMIRPGEKFDYSSFCPLSTPVGTMHGTYQMMTETGEVFDATIAPFTLAVPGSLH